MRLLSNLECLLGQSGYNDLQQMKATMMPETKSNAAIVNVSDNTY
jgi:hypothetical protein